MVNFDILLYRNYFNICSTFQMADLKKVTRENQKLREEMIKLTWKNQASLAINDEIYVR